MASGSKSIPWTTYCAQLSMSREGTRVSSPAQRPTMLSTPSAPMTMRARTSDAPRAPSPRARHPPAPHHALAAVGSDDAARAPLVRPARSLHSSSPAAVHAGDPGHLGAHHDLG